MPGFLGKIWGWGGFGRFGASKGFCANSHWARLGVDRRQEGLPKNLLPKVKFAEVWMNALGANCCSSCGA